MLLKCGETEYMHVACGEHGLVDIDVTVRVVESTMEVFAATDSSAVRI